jgi:hypothetical protein
MVIGLTITVFSYSCFIRDGQIAQVLYFTVVNYGYEAKLPQFSTPPCQNRAKVRFENNKAGLQVVYPCNQLYK